MISIQISNPILLPITDEEVTSLEDVIENIFPLDTEYLILIWNNIFIPLNYKYDISVMILDFIKIFDFLKDDETDTLEMHWASNTFSSIWKMEKRNSYVNIKSFWKSVNGGIEDKLNELSENTIALNDFTEEIKKLLVFLKNSIQKSGIDCHLIEDCTILDNVVTT